MRTLGIYIIPLLMLVPLTVWAAPVELVKNGRAVAEIVVDSAANQSVKQAANDVQFYLRKISGADLPIVNVPTGGRWNRVYIGESSSTKVLGFKPTPFTGSGYEIIARDNYVILSGLDRLSVPPPFSQTVDDSLYQQGKIPRPTGYPSQGLKKWQEFCGEKFDYSSFVNNGAGYFVKALGLYTNDDTGTWYAATELLEQIGVRFYAPYDDGTVVPEMKDITIAEQELKREAAFPHREWFYSRGEEQGVAWIKHMKCGNRLMIINNHTTYAIFSSKEQHELHPEYLACDNDGKAYPGYPSGAGIPRFGDPGFRRASAILLDKLFEAFPELHAVAMGPPDGGVKIDARDVSLYGKESATMEQRISNCVWDYNVFLARELQKAHPDKFLLYMVYGEGVKQLPTNKWDGMPGNIILSFTQQPCSADCVLNDAKKTMLVQRHQWLDFLKQKGKSPIWDYFLYYRFPNQQRYPVFFTTELQNEMREMQPYADGKFIEVPIARQSNGASGEAGFQLGLPAIMHLMIYWQSKLLWDPGADRKAVLDEYYRLYFGPAATEMKEFHEFAEEVWNRQVSRRMSPVDGFITIQDVNKYFEILAWARAKVDRDSVYDRRIAAMEAAYQPLKKFFPGFFNAR